jgi:hypothetical protein
MNLRTLTNGGASVCRRRPLRPHPHQRRRRGRHRARRHHDREAPDALARRRRPGRGFSLEPQEFADMVQAVKRAAAALGEVKYGPGPGEDPTLRRSLWVRHDTAQGEPLRFGENVVTARPALGLPPATPRWWASSPRGRSRPARRCSWRTSHDPRQHRLRRPRPGAELLRHGNYKIELICGLSARVHHAHHQGALQGHGYQRAARLYNFWCDERQARPAGFHAPWCSLFFRKRIRLWPPQPEQQRVQSRAWVASQASPTNSGPRSASASSKGRGRRSSRAS